jgi:hypothetical protein
MTVDGEERARSSCRFAPRATSTTRSTLTALEQAFAWAGFWAL